ncbi:hypothetical protein EJK15_51725 [Nonomuraea basaltis]|nr:hypothetical protein EJK15_51725 [Nonomuraea basaltis]
MSNRKPYPSDISDARWALIEPTLTAWPQLRTDRPGPRQAAAPCTRLPHRSLSTPSSKRSRSSSRRRAACASPSGDAAALRPRRISRSPARTASTLQACTPPTSRRSPTRRRRRGDPERSP